MKISHICMVAALVCAGAPAVANAEVYVLTASGTVQSLTLAENNTFTDAAPGKIKVGDTFNLSATFDTSKAITSPYVIDPAVAFYYLNGANVTVYSGSYTSSFTPTNNLGSSLQLWNDYNVVGPTDAQSFQFFNYNYPGPYPFDLTGAPIMSEGVNLNAFDWTHQARSDISIDSLNASSNDFSSTSLSYSFSNSDKLGSTDKDVIVNVSNAKFSLLPVVSPVPEPATWALMLVGFGGIGFSMRRRKAQPKVSFA